MSDTPSPKPKRPTPSGLIPWKPGQSGNPAGGSRKARVTAALRRLIKKKGGPDQLAKVWYAVMMGDPSVLPADSTNPPEFVWFREALDRIEGKVTDKVEQVGQQTIRVTYDDDQPPDHDQLAPPPPGPAGDTATHEEI